MNVFKRVLVSVHLGGGGGGGKNLKNLGFGGGGLYVPKKKNFDSKRGLENPPEFV